MCICIFRPWSFCILGPLRGLHDKVKKKESNQKAPEIVEKRFADRAAVMQWMYQRQDSRRYWTAGGTGQQANVRRWR